MGIDGSYINIIKAVYKNPTANIILNAKIFVSFKILNKLDVCINCLFNILLEILATEEIRELKIGKEEVKLSLFTDDMIPYTENSKDITK